MNDPLEEFFNNRAASNLGREAQLEREAVRKILVKSGSKNRTAETFSDLQAIGFPMRLTARAPKKRDMQGLFLDLFSRPTKTFPYGAYTDALEEFPDAEGQLGVVMPWFGKGGLYVFHDWATVTLGTAGFYIKMDGRYFYFEKLTSLIERLGPAEDW